ncbi:unnamed protein product [Ectocarpus sp. 12 AP-2014]
MVLRSAEGSVAAVAVVAAALTCYLGAVDAACDGESAPEISWEESSNHLYINGGCATMADIYEDCSYNLAQKALCTTLTSHIHIRNAATLEIDGTGGLAFEILLMVGNNDLTGTGSLNIRAHGGNLVVRDTKIFSWGITTGTYDADTSNGRPYLSAITEFITGRDEDLCPSDTQAGEDGYSTGQAKEQMGVARMDIYDSELACERSTVEELACRFHQNLGYSESESYGLQGSRVVQDPRKCRHLRRRPGFPCVRSLRGLRRYLQVQAPQQLVRALLLRAPRRQADRQRRLRQRRLRLRPARRFRPPRN